MKGAETQSKPVSIESSIGAQLPPAIGSLYLSTFESTSGLMYHPGQAIEAAGM